MNNTDVQMLMKMLMQVICMTWNRSDVKYGWPVYRLLDAILHIPPVIGPVQEGLHAEQFVAERLSSIPPRCIRGILRTPLATFTDKEQAPHAAL